MSILGRDGVARQDGRREENGAGWFSEWLATAAGQAACRCRRQTGFPTHRLGASTRAQAESDGSKLPRQSGGKPHALQRSLPKTI
jgi:hypothetical protein